MKSQNLCKILLGLSFSFGGCNHKNPSEKTGIVTEETFVKGEWNYSIGRGWTKYPDRYYLEVEFKNKKITYFVSGDKAIDWDRRYNLWDEFSEENVKDWAGVKKISSADK